MGQGQGAEWGPVKPLMLLLACWRAVVCSASLEWHLAELHAMKQPSLSGEEREQLAVQAGAQLQQ